MASLNTIIGWFSSRVKPTASQFSQAWSSFRHKDVNVPMNEVAGLNDALNGKASVADLNQVINNNSFVILLNPETTNYEVPAGTLIRSFCIIDDIDLSFSVGLTPEGKEYIEDAVAVVGAEILDVPKYFREATTIYFSGISTQTIIRITKG